MLFLLIWRRGVFEFHFHFWIGFITKSLVVVINLLESGVT